MPGEAALSSTDVSDASPFAKPARDIPGPRRAASVGHHRRKQQLNHQLLRPFRARRSGGRSGPPGSANGKIRRAQKK